MAWGLQRAALRRPVEVCLDFSALERRESRPLRRARASDAGAGSSCSSATHLQRWRVHSFASAAFRLCRSPSAQNQGDAGAPGRGPEHVLQRGGACA